LNHQERPRILLAWLRDYLDPELVEDLLDVTGKGLDVKRFVSELEGGDKEMLAWWAREMARDGELEELFRLLSTKAGYRPRQTVAGAVKRKRRRRGGGALVAFLIFAFILRGLSPAPFPHVRQMRAAAFALRGRECFLLAAAQAA
jgi:hypothetical protein